MPQSRQQLKWSPLAFFPGAPLQGARRALTVCPQNTLLLLTQSILTAVREAVGRTCTAKPLAKCIDGVNADGFQSGQACLIRDVEGLGWLANFWLIPSNGMLKKKALPDSAHTCMQ